MRAAAPGHPPVHPPVKLRFSVRSAARPLTRWFTALALVMLAAASACAGPGSDTGAALAEAMPVAAGVYLLKGSGGEPDNANLGRIGNAGFIVGESGVVAIDTGVSYQHGVALLAAIRRVTDKPVRLALITHTRQEFLFGAAAFRERGIPVAMHTRAATLMAARCDTCLKNLRKLLGEDAMQGTAMFKPDRTFDTAQRLDTLADRPLQVLYFGHSSGPGDIAVFDPRSGVLFAGGLIDNQRIPDLIDSDLPGWRRALLELHKLPIKAVVPGHGPAGGARSIDDVERYLAQLVSRVRELVTADVPLSQVADAATLPEFKDWDQYDNIHRRNASIIFLRVEREQLYKSGE